MTNIPDDLRYSAEHEWVRVEGNTATIGITDCLDLNYRDYGPGSIARFSIGSRNTLSVILFRIGDALRRSPLVDKHCPTD